MLCAGRRHRPHNVQQHALRRHPGRRLLILNVAKLSPGFRKLHIYMLNKAKQLQLLITRALCRMAFATIPARRRRKVWPSRSPPPGIRDFSNGAFRQHLWHHAKSSPWDGRRRKIFFLFAGQLVDVICLLSLFHTTILADLAVLIPSPLT